MERLKHYPNITYNVNNNGSVQIYKNGRLKVVMQGFKNVNAYVLLDYIYQACEHHKLF